MRDTATSDIKQRDIILLIVALCSAAEEFGRTSLQKVAYFVSEEFRRGFGHEAYYFGPYSEIVEDEVDTLVKSGLIEEMSESLPFVSERGFPGKRYRYALTRQGKDRVAALQLAYPRACKGLEAFLAKLRAAADGYDQRILSSAAKTFYLAKREGKALSLGEIQGLGRDLGWELSQGQLTKVVDVLKALDLIDVP